MVNKVYRFVKEPEDYPRGLQRQIVLEAIKEAIKDKEQASVKEIADIARRKKLQAAAGVDASVAWHLNQMRIRGFVEDVGLAEFIPEFVPPQPEPLGKTRITIRLDDDLMEYFQREADQSGGTTGYQTLINSALHEFVEGKAAKIEDTLRRIVREEIRAASQISAPQRAMFPRP